MDSLEDLPIEIILVILSYMSFDTLMTLSQTSKKYYFLIHEEILSGQLVIDLEVDKKVLKGYEIKPKLQDFPNLRSLKLVHFEDLQAILSQIILDTKSGLNLYLNNCSLKNFHLLDFATSLKLKGLHFGFEDPIPTRIYQDLIVLKSHEQQITSLTLPLVPQMFVPLILTNHGSITELEIGECSNQLIYIICQNLKHLTKLAFNGENITYSGVVGLVGQKDYLKSLSIKNPKCLTKHSLKLLATHLTKLISLRLFWIGKMLINNPWSFEFCLDRDEQRVDNLFENGSLEYLTELDLSAFYQTIDNQTIQSLCYNHLSSNSVTKDHLRKISLNHCYRITDTGIQWMVGSCHSIKISYLNLSNTALTGNCFLRKMSSLNTLILECCSSLNGQGLQNMASSCPQLKHLSLSMNKQLTDEDLSLAFKAGLRNLEVFLADYVNINGSCFKHFKAYDLKKLSIHSCSKIKDEFGLKEYLGSNLKKLSYLDLSVSNITGILFEGIEMPSLKSLYLDFCNKLCNQNLRCLDNFQKLKSLSIFGCDVEIESVVKIQDVVRSTGEESEVQLREFASKRGLKLTNWSIVKKHMIKGMPFMLSQIYLTSLADRE